MQFEDITIRFRLLIVEPTQLCLKINTVIYNQKHFSIGRHEISATISADYYEDYTVGLSTVGTISGPCAVIENLAVTWHDDRKITLFHKDRKENEIWDYSGNEEIKKYLDFENSPSHRTVNLEYQLDNKHNGFINNFGYYKHASGRTDSLINNGNNPYVISSAGEFVFNFKSPIAYWLLERLFYVPSVDER